MQSKGALLPKVGDYAVYRVRVLSANKLAFILNVKMTDTELASAIAKNCVEGETEAQAKLKAYAENKATEIFKNNQFDIGVTINKPYTPCW